MMRSLYSGVSGLKNHQTRMDVIGNNIANVNTVGFKSSRVVFQDVYSQMSKNASAPNGDISGGTNPMQIGLGVNLAAIDIIHSSAATQRTDRILDLAIEGDGYFTVMMPTGELMYTRAGNLYIDEEGNLLNSTGNFVLGIQQNATYIVRESYVDDSVDPPVTVPSHIVASAAGDFVDGTDTTNSTYFDADGNPLEGFTVVKGIDPNSYVLKDDTLTDLTQLYSLKNFGELKPDAMTRATLTTLNLHGYTGISIDDKGTITGLNANAERETIGIIGVATFTNASGLEKKGNNLYAATVNTGDPVFNQAQSGGAGTINPGGLEMSNVDLANEFTDMIVTQRGFQANSRIITTSDSMLEELVNLKR